MSAAESHILPVYAPPEQIFVRGEGSWIWDEKGDKYLDCIAGIAVNALGFGHPVIRQAMAQALDAGLVHVSNLYHTEPGERLAEALVARSFADAVFFCNSGAEANEGAFKFARRATGRTDIVAFTGGFHGRLFASLAATDRPDYRRPFEPLLAGVRIVPLSDRAAADAAVEIGGVDLPLDVAGDRHRRA